MDLGGASTSNELHQQHDHGDNQKQVHQTAGHMKTKTKCPKDEENDEDGPEHNRMGFSGNRLRFSLCAYEREVLRTAWLPPTNKEMWTRWRFMLFGMAAWLATGVVYPQSPTPDAPPSPSPVPAATPYPLSLIAPQADATLAELAQFRSELTGDDFADSLHKLVPKLTSDLERKEKQTDKTLGSIPKIGVLQEEVNSWSVLHEDVLLRLGLLSGKLKRVDNISQQLAAMEQSWNLTRPTLQGAGVPIDLRQKAASVLEQITATGKTVAAKRTELLGLQSTLVNQSAQIAGILSRVEKARSEALNQLPLRDSQPLWLGFQKIEGQPLPTEAAFAPQLALIRNHLFTERGVVLLHLTLWFVLILVFRWARAAVKRLTAADAELNRSTVIFEVPVATATLIALLFASPFYAGVSPVLTAILGAALLVPLLRIVGRIIVPSLQPITWALALFYLSAQIREATSPFPFISRLIYLAEMIGGVFFSLWLIKESRGKRSTLWFTLQVAGRVGFALFLVAGVANILGYVNLAQFVSSVMLDSSYVAILLYAAAHILAGLVTFALNVRPMTHLAIVRRHRALLEVRISWVCRALGVVLWAAFVLNKVLLLQPLLHWTKAAVKEPLVAGVTLGGIFTFLITVWASFLISRFVRFLLEEDVYQRVQLKPGLPFAISTMLHYVILLLGFYLATAALLGDMSKFAILAGAFGVGIGFGLQNIVNNFVSSIIVLFERPIKIGDLVQIGTQQGTVRSIGIRATIIRSSDGSDVIIPNGKLISDPVTNWTLTSHQRQLQISVVTPVKGVDADQVIRLLEQAANETANIAKSPAPSGILASFGANQLQFEIRVWTDDPQNARRLRSDLGVAISRLLAQHEIPTV